MNNSISCQLARTVDTLTECPQAEIHTSIPLIQQDAGDRKATSHLFFLQSGYKLRWQDTFTVSYEHNISIFKVFLLHQSQCLVQRCAKICTAMDQLLLDENIPAKIDSKADVVRFLTFLKENEANFFQIHKSLVSGNSER